MCIQCGAVSTRPVFGLRTHKLHPIAHPLERVMECLLWVETDLYSGSGSAVVNSVPFDIGLRYNDIRLYLPRYTVDEFMIRHQQDRELQSTYCLE